MGFIKTYLNYIIIAAFVGLLLVCSYLYVSKASVEKKLTVAEADLETAKKTIKDEKDNNAILASDIKAKERELDAMNKLNHDTNVRVAELTVEKNSLQKALDKYLASLPEVVPMPNGCTESVTEQKNSLQRITTVWQDYCEQVPGDPDCVDNLKPKGEKK